MTRAISRDSFQELKNYLGVQFQQGRPILDADLNEAQAVTLSLLRRLGQEALGEGSPNEGFAVSTVYMPTMDVFMEGVPDGTAVEDLEQVAQEMCYVDLFDVVLHAIFGPVLFFLTIPGELLDDFESDEFTASSPQGRLRVAHDRPYQGSGYLRLSGHAGTVTVSRRLDEPRDLSAFELATFRFRLNRQVPGIIRFFIEDDSGNRTVWPCGNPAFAADTWLAAVAVPLDIRFQLLSSTLPPVAVDDSLYEAEVVTYGGTAPVTWEIVTGNELVPDLTIEPSGSGTGGTVRFTVPPTLGTVTFTVQATDAEGRTATGELSVAVTEPPAPVRLEDLALLSLGELVHLGRPEAPTGTPADVSVVRRYGFELYQDADEPLVWDLDDLRLGSSDLHAQAAHNDFIIRGSEVNKLLAQLTVMSALMTEDDSDAQEPAINEEGVQQALDLLNTELDVAGTAEESPGRFYVAGLPCVQVEDVLYSQQADPNDPPLSPPPPGQRRVDTVYLDAWTEPVTFVQDPAIREVALGGMDTSTRERVRHRVRVAQGSGVPTGDGRGLGTLATEGTYTAVANRLYRVEIDGPGDIGEATFRWSNENASVVARVIEPVPPGSTTLVLEDASTFHPGDLILLRKEFGAERHQVQQVTGNEITLAGPTGGQLAELPGAATPGFTTFALADRPMVQRWDGLGVAVTADPEDETISASIPLDDGVRVRFGGSQMLAGDNWTFTARYLAGDEPTGIDPVTRIERLDYVRPRGVRHHYAPLAELVRDGDAVDPDIVDQARDRRQALGGSRTAATSLPDVTGLSGTDPVHLGGIRLPPGSRGSKLLVYWSGDLYLPSGVSSDTTLDLLVSFFNDEMTDPQAEPGVGKIQDRQHEMRLGRRRLGVDIPFTHLFVNSDLGASFLPPTTMVPTSVQVFASLSIGSATVELTSMQLTVLELKNSH